MHHCGRFIDPPLTRRQMLRRCGNGFGAVALAATWAQQQAAEASTQRNPFAPREPHYKPRARNVIFLYMDGGPSQVDTFDPKPRLQRESGQPFGAPTEPTQFDNIGDTLGSPWAFRNYGESGLPVSDLFPHVGQCADDLAVIRSMTSDFSEHTSANYFLHTGFGQQGRPSMGAWVGYGLGSECKDLPAFLVLNGGLVPPGGLDNFNSGFLPATYQASMFKAGKRPVANIEPQESRRLQASKLDLMKRLDAESMQRAGEADAIESAIANYELAARMQAAVPDLTDLASESAATKRSYGMEAKFKGTQVFGRQCLLARRLVERGVRFIELTCPQVGHDRWDQHGGLKKGHERNAKSVDQPIAALLKDLKRRGLLEETLVVWAGEFGRTPFAQGTNGRDHNPYGFSVWMAGGGVKGGTVYGRTDEYGYKAIENRCTIHDLHATMLHLLGLNHETLTFRFSGRDMSLTDVHGHILHDIVA